MANPWDAEINITEELVSTLLSEQFPQIEVKEIELLGRGFDNAVYLINQEYVFRFPSKQQAVSLLETEGKLLPEISPHFELATPCPIFFGEKSSHYPWPFLGYKELPGSIPKSIPLSARIHTAKPLAQFLKTLHAIPVSKAKELGVPYDEYERMNVTKRKVIMEEYIVKVVEMGLWKDEQSLHHYFQEGLPCEPLSGREYLVHGDIHIRNVLTDHNGVVTSIIDWGDVHIGYQAADLSFIYSFLDVEGRKKFYEIYGDVDETSKRYARFKAVYISLVLMLYAHDQGDDQLVKDATESLSLSLK
jgi:aminoglycoside phosphotransferase (APT) family kinase protein